MEMGAGAEGAANKWGRDIQRLQVLVVENSN